MSSPLMNETQAAEYLTLAVKTLARWRWAKKGPDYTRLHGAIRYTKEQLDDFIAKGATKA